MPGAKHKANWKIYSGLMAMMLIGLTVIAGVTKLWVLTAIPVGLLFGFFLQKGALCGASAFSEVILMKDKKKLWGLWIAIVTSMGGFALIDLLGWVTLNPKPFTWLSMIVGGVVFGVGIVLAGGCVSGSLFKAGTGHINSIVALFSIALGVAAVEAGPLAALNRWMKGHVLTATGGGPVTLGSITGLPFWALALLLIFLTLAGVVLYRRKNPKEEEQEKTAKFSDVLTRRRWKPWQAGLAIGLLGALAYLSSAAVGRNYPLGVTHGVYHAQVLITDYPVVPVFKKASPKPVMDKTLSTEVKETKPPVLPRKKINVWLIFEIVALVIGAWVAARLSGEAKLYNKSADQILVALIGGFLVGAGAGFAKGCIVGNILSGWALMSVGTVVFGLVVMLSSWITTYFYLMGGKFSDLRK